MSERSNVLAGAWEAAVQSGWLNPANLITAFRVFLTPPIIILLLASPPVHYQIAGGLFVLAALTDKLDGYYARKNEAVTRLGEFLDPLADKLLVLPIMITLSWVGLLPWWASGIVVAREVIVSAIRFVGIKRKVSFPASWSGKIKMFSQIIVISFLIFFYGSAGSVLAKVFIYAMVAITAYSGIEYVVRARREIFSRSDARDS